MLKLRHGGKGSWIFLFLVLVIYGAVAFVDLEVARGGLIFFKALLLQLLPVLAAMIAIIFAVNLFLQPKQINSYLGTQAGIKGWLLALLAGILSVGPVYPWYAVLHDLKSKDLAPSLAATFLYSRAIKIPLVPLIAHYFGLQYTVVLLACLLILAIVNGLIMVRVL